MPVPPSRPPVLNGRVFRGATAVRRGLLTTDQLRSTAWIQVRRDVYADARLPRDHRLACVAALIRLPPGAVLAGRSAAFLHGVTHAAEYADPVHIITPSGVRVGSQQRLARHHVALTQAEVAPGLLPVTSVERTVWDVARWHDPLVAVPIIDSLLAQGRTTPAALIERIDRHRGDRGWRRAQRVHELVDPAAQSPAESRLRVRLIMAGLPKPVAQHPVRVAGGRLLHPDLAWPPWRVALEYDGLWHATADQLHRDRHRLNQLITAGWTVLHVTSRRLATDFPALVTEIRTALTRNGYP